MCFNDKMLFKHISKMSVYLTCVQKQAFALSPGMACRWREITCSDFGSPLFHQAYLMFLILVHSHILLMPFQTSLLAPIMYSFTSGVVKTSLLHKHYQNWPAVYIFLPSSLQDLNTVNHCFRCSTIMGQKKVKQCEGYFLLKVLFKLLTDMHAITACS